MLGGLTNSSVELLDNLLARLCRQFLAPNINFPDHVKVSPLDAIRCSENNHDEC